MNKFKNYVVNECGEIIKKRSKIAKDGTVKGFWNDRFNVVKELQLYCLADQYNSNGCYTYSAYVGTDNNIYVTINSYSEGVYDKLYTGSEILDELDTYKKIGDCKISEHLNSILKLLRDELDININ